MCTGEEDGGRNREMWSRAVVVPLQARKRRDQHVTGDAQRHVKIVCGRSTFDVSDSSIMPFKGDHLCAAG